MPSFAPVAEPPSSPALLVADAPYVDPPWVLDDDQVDETSPDRYQLAVAVGDGGEGVGQGLLGVVAPHAHLLDPGRRAVPHPDPPARLPATVLGLAQQRAEVYHQVDRRERAGGVLAEHGEFVVAGPVGGRRPITVRVELVPGAVDPDVVRAYAEALRVA